MLVDVGAQLFVTDLVALFVLAVIRQVLLDGIIGEVDAACVLRESVLVGCGAHVAVFVPIPFDESVYRGHHDVVAQVELSAVVQQGSLDVGLDDEGAVTAVWVFLSLFEDGFDLLESEAHLDAVAAIAVLSGLDNPGIVFLDVPLFLTSPGDFFGPSVVVLEELEVLLVLEPVLDVEGKRKIAEHVFFDLCVVVGHGVEESLLVPQDVVVYEMVMHFLFIYLAHFHYLAILEVLPSRGQPLVIALLGSEVCLEVAFEVLDIEVGQDRLVFVFRLLSLLLAYFSFEAFLPLEEGELLELRPYEVGVFGPISKGKPGSASDQATNHARVVPFSNKHLNSVLILHRNLHDPLVRKVHLPNQVSVVIRLKGDVELFAVLSELMLGAWRVGWFFGVGRSPLDVEHCFALR